MVEWVSFRQPMFVRPKKHSHSNSFIVTQNHEQTEHMFLPTIVVRPPVHMET
jgi:hypothetical protein